MPYLKGLTDAAVCQITRRISAAVLASASLAVLANPAAADVIVLCQNIQGGVLGAGGCTQAQGNSLTNENILFNNPPFTSTTASAPSTTVVGETQTTNTLFDFHTTTDLLTLNGGGGGGFATIHAEDGAVSNLSYFVDPNQLLGSTFNAYTALDTNLDVGQNTSGLVQFTITAQTSTGTPETFITQQFALTGGANNFTFEAINGEVITNVTFNATNVSSVLVEDVKQTSVNLANTAIPEPGTLIVLGTALVGLGLSGWRRKMRKAEPA
jgi:hypothetical protein